MSVDREQEDGLEFIIKTLVSNGLMVYLDV